MSIKGERIRVARKNKKLSQDELAKTMGMTRENISHYETGKIVNIPTDVLQKLSEVLDVPFDYLLGNNNFINNNNFVRESSEPYNPMLNKKDEKNIQIELQKMIDGLHGKNAYAAFDGLSFSDMDEEDRELLIASLENTIRLAKRLAKQKFTPEKYRK